MKLNVQVVLFKPDIQEFEKFVKSLDQNLKVTSLMYSKFSIHFLINEGNVQLEKRITEITQRHLKIFQCQVFMSSKNMGHGAGHNKIFFENIEVPDFIWILNPDGVLDANCLQNLTKSILSKPRAVIAEAKQLPLDHPKSYNRKTFETKWSSGACILIKAEAFSEVGGFDEKFFLHGDDVDLSYRLRRSGGRLYLIPNALFWHSKRVAENGFPNVSLAESIYGPLGALMLTWKYRQPIKRWIMINHLRKSNSQIHRTVLQLYKVFQFDSKKDKRYLQLNSYLRPWKFSRHRY